MALFVDEISGGTAGGGGNGGLLLPAFPNDGSEIRAFFGEKVFEGCISYCLEDDMDVQPPRFNGIDPIVRTEAHKATGNSMISCEAMGLGE